MKVCAACGIEIDVKDGINHCNQPECKRQRRNKKQRELRRERDDLMASLGLKRVRGALGGVYYE